MIHILYDHREKVSGIPALLQKQDLLPEETTLAEGDYVISNRICIERKSAQDFTASIKDGRLWRQIEEMKKNYEVIILLLEGEPYFPKNSLQGALASLARKGVTLLRVEDEKESAEIILRLIVQEAKPGQMLQRNKLKRKDRSKNEIQEDMLASLPGISTKKAADLLSHFKSLEKIIAASSLELKQVTGIGNKTANSLEKIFKHSYEKRDND